MISQPRTAPRRLAFSAGGALAVTLPAAGLYLAGAPAWLFWAWLGAAAPCYLAVRCLMAIHDELGRIALKVRAGEPLTDYEAKVVARLHLLPDDLAELDGTPL